MTGVDLSFANCAALRKELLNFSRLDGLKQIAMNAGVLCASSRFSSAVRR